mmetsp:Transcript_48045/g.150776  ORF Transcript_48045/g.150776 Transcript_48045/m.150776 type:complete len:726 (-) Transcript_48045:24-2201(-)
MPMDKKRKAHQPKASDHIQLHERCFRIRFTGELYSTYEEYIEQLLAYQSRNWSCGLTGKSKLTFEEAQLSERTAQKKVDDAFPEFFVEPLCRMVHMSQTRMDDLIEFVYKRLQCFMNGEEVEYLRGDQPPLFARIVRPLDVEDDFWTNIDAEAPLPTRYLVELLSEEGLPVADEMEHDHAESLNGMMDEPGETEENEARYLQIEAAQLRRLKSRNISRITLKSKLRTVGSRQSYWQAPFLCEPELVSRFGLREELPPHMRRLQLQYEVRVGKLDKEALAELGVDPSELVKKKKKKSTDVDKDPQKIMRQVLKTPAQKRIWEIGRTGKLSTTSDMSVFDIAQSLYQDWLHGDGSRGIEAGLTAEQYFNDIYEMIQLVLSVWPQDAEKSFLPFPVEDTMLPPDPSLEERPQPITSLFVPDSDLVLPSELLGKVLQIWDFIQRYHKIVRLSPFSLEDLAGAVCYPTETPLATEFHCAFLRYLLHQSMEAQAKEDSDRREFKREDEDYDENAWSESTIPMPKPSAVDETRWSSTLVAYLQASRSTAVDILPSLPSETLEVLETGGFDEMTMQMRVDVMCLLCDDACATSGIHQQLNQAFEETREIQKGLREEEQKIKEQKKEARLEKQQAKERIQAEIQIQMEAKGEGAEKEEETKKSGKQKKSQEEDEKQKQKKIAAAAKQALAEQKEKDAKKQEQEREEQENLRRKLESELEKHVVRVLPLGFDRSK